MKRTTIFAAALSAAMVLSVPAQAAYEFTENFEGGSLPIGGDAYIAQFTNSGGNYSNNDIGALGMDYSVPSPPEFIPTDRNGSFLNFYARYDDANIRQTALFRNLGGFSGSDPFSSNNGEHTLTACVYLRDISDGGADFGAGVDGGLGVRISGTGYSQWPGDASFNHQQSVSSLPRGRWSRVNLTFTITDGSRVDAGVWVSNPALTVPYVSTGVFYDDLWLGASADAPTNACGGLSDPGPEGIPVLPLWGLFGLVGLIGLMGMRLRRKA